MHLNFKDTTQLFTLSYLRVYLIAALIIFLLTLINRQKKQEIDTKTVTSGNSNFNSKVNGFDFGKSNKYSPTDIIDKANPDSNFMSDLNRDRFGVSLEPKVTRFLPPGPGAYDLPNVDLTKKNTMKLGVFGQGQRVWENGQNNSIFLHANTKDRNPGPAYYQIIPLEKKTSFHYDRID